MEKSNMEWLDDQTMNIPIKVFIDMRLEIANLEKRNSDVIEKRWEVDKEVEKLTAENKELRLNLTEAKGQIRALLGVDEEDTNADDGR